VTGGWAESYHGQIRALAGDEPVLIFVGARCVARDADGRVLLIRRRDNGLWALPAGAMEIGDSIAACAARELREESGLRAGEVTPFAMYSGPDYTSTNMYGHTYQVFSTAFLVESWSGELLTETDETTGAGFFAPDDMPEPLSPNVARALADLATFEETGRLVLR
jgi:ADP-ribose pyrophosphatase YjhB (NUDIX family)